MPEHTITSAQLAAILETGYLDVTYKCPDCKGSGNEQYVSYECEECGMRWGTAETSKALNEHLNAQWAARGSYGVSHDDDTTTLPCGHSVKLLKSDVYGCTECECSGEQVKRLNMADLARVVAAAILGQREVLVALQPGAF